MIVLCQLLLAHLLGDFFLQPRSWVRDKQHKKLKSIYLYLHGLVHGALILGIVGSWSFWKPALVLVAVHLVIDSTKLMLQTRETERSWFFIDQGLHLLTLVGVWACLKPVAIHLPLQLLSERQVLIPVLTAALILHPSAYLIKAFLSKWTPDPMASEASASDTLLSDQAGKWIGMLERMLVVGCVVLGHWEGIGFLLAAKSVFRFGDLNTAKSRKLTEYVLMGTLLSFGIALGAGQLALYLLGH